MTKLHYFAYGSNLHPLRLRERVPSACVIGVIEAKGLKLTFSKRSEDHSGKCNVFQSGNPGDVVFGVVYEIDSKEKRALDEAESKGHGYNEQFLSCDINGLSFEPFTYVADSKYVDSALRPYEWYKQLVIEGAKYHLLPEEYISSLEAVFAVPDPDSKRSAKNMARLSNMKKFNEGVNSGARKLALVARVLSGKAAMSDKGPLPS